MLYELNVDLVYKHPSATVNNDSKQTLTIMAYYITQLSDFEAFYDCRHLL